MGWWVVSEETGEVIVDNHPAVIERERFETGYIQLTGHTLDGVKVDVPTLKRHQARKKRETLPNALLQFILTCPLVTEICVTGPSHDKKGRDKYVGQGKAEGGLRSEVLFSVPCTSVDNIVVERLRALVEADRAIAERIEKNLQSIRAKQVEDCISIDDQIASLNISLAKLRKRLLTLSDILEDESGKETNGLSQEETEEEKALRAIGDKIKELAAQKRALEEKRQRITTVKGPEEIRQFYDALSNFDAKWPELTIEQKQRLLGLLTKKVTIEPVSTHWLRLSIEWIGPVYNRPDVALIWRTKGTRQPKFTSEERATLVKLYPTAKPSEILQALPNRTWGSINFIAPELNVQRSPEARHANSVDVPPYATWEDIKIFPSIEEGKQVIMDMMTRCKNEKTPIVGMWLISNERLKELVKPHQEGENNECIEEGLTF